MADSHDEQVARSGAAPGDATRQSPKDAQAASPASDGKQVSAASGQSSSNSESKPQANSPSKPERQARVAGSVGNQANDALASYESKPWNAEEDEGKEKRVAMRLIAAAIAVMAHILVILVALFLVFVVGKEPPKEKVVIPAIALSEDPGATMEMEALEPMEAASESQVQTPQTNTTVNPTPTEVQTEAFALTGVGGSTSNPLGDVDLNGELSVGFMGSGGNAKSIVFVIDASGSLVAAYPDIIKELKRSIQQLSPQQTFHVIFFTGLENRPVFALKQNKMFRGTADEKARVSGWVDVDAHNVEPGSQGDPVAAIRAALSLDPELVYILSDNITGQGKYEVNRDDLIRQVQTANRKKTKINTIQFFYPDSLDPNDQTKWTLFRIAQMSGGKFKYVDADELYGP